MKLITYIDDFPYYHDEVKIIKEFRKIIERDKGSKGDADGRKKRLSVRELAFIHWYCSYDSRFQMYQDRTERVNAIKEAVDLPDDWKPDADIVAAINRYKDLTYSPSKKLIETALKSIDKLQYFLEHADLDERNKSNGLIFGPKDLQAALKALPDTIESLNKAQEIVRKEMEDESNTKKKKNLFEDK